MANSVRYNSRHRDSALPPSPLARSTLLAFITSAGIPKGLQNEAGKWIARVLLVAGLVTATPMAVYLRMTGAFDGLGGINLALISFLVLMSLALLLIKHAAGKILLVAALLAAAFTGADGDGSTYSSLLLIDLAGIVSLLFFGGTRGGLIYVTALLVPLVLGSEFQQYPLTAGLILLANGLVSIQFAYVIWLGTLAMDNEVAGAELIARNTDETLKAQQDLLRFLTLESRPALTSLLAHTANDLTTDDPTEASATDENVIPDAVTPVNAQQYHKALLADINQLSLLADDLKSVYGTESPSLHDYRSSFAEVFNSVSELMGPMLLQREISFTQGQPTHLTNHYNVESGRVRSIILGLMRIAIFTERVAVADLRASVELSNNHSNPVVVRLTLTGSGLPLDDIQACLHEEESPGYPISLVWQELRWIQLWLEEMGGQLGLETSIAQNDERTLSIRITIPMSSKAIPDPELPNVQTGILGNQKVLVVDDDPVSRRATAALLKSRFGANVEQAASVQEATKKLTKLGPFKLVVTDFIMPGRSGADLMTSDVLRESNTPVIVLTASVTQEELISLQKVGAMSILSKPATETKLALELRRLFTDQAELQQQAVNDGGRNVH